jgi:hypothetical protein
MKKLQPKRAFRFLLAATLLASFTITGCKDGEKKTEEETNKMDEGNTMPIKPAPKEGTMGKDSAAATMDTTGNTMPIKPAP